MAESNWSIVRRVSLSSSQRVLYQRCMHNYWFPFKCTSSNEFSSNIYVSIPCSPDKCRHSEVADHEKATRCCVGKCSSTAVIRSSLKQLFPVNDDSTRHRREG